MDDWLNQCKLKSISFVLLILRNDNLSPIKMVDWVVHVPLTIWLDRWSYKTCVLLPNRQYLQNSSWTQIFKSHKISFAHNIHFRHRHLLIFCTDDFSSTIALCAQFPNDLNTDPLYTNEICWNSPISGIADQRYANITSPTLVLFSELFYHHNDFKLTI